MKRAVGMIVAVALAVLVAPWGRAEESGLMAGYGPLSAEQREIFFGSPQDEPAAELQATEKRLEGRHYVTCDEWYLHLFEPRIKNLGGGYAGVGTDQAYLLIGWQRPHLAWLFDYDPWVAYLHEAYGVFFKEAATREEFLAFWTNKDDKATAKLLEEKLAGHPDAAMIVKVFRHNRDYISRRLKRVAKVLEKAKSPSYLTDAEVYEFVRNLVVAGRVRPMVGDLLKEKGMLGMAEVSRRLAVPIRVIYTSNAEGYWKYTEQFRKNFIGQNFDDQSLVVRTVAAKWTNGDYRYNVQKATNFQEWLKQDYVTSFRQIVPMGQLKGKDDIPLTYVDDSPERARPKEKGKGKKKGKGE